jgi:hypothetical protein
VTFLIAIFLLVLFVITLGIVIAGEMALIACMEAFRRERSVAAVFSALLVVIIMAGTVGGFVALCVFVWRG